MEIVQVNTKTQKENVHINGSNVSILRCSYLFEGKDDIDSFPDTYHRIVEYISMENLLKEIGVFEKYQQILKKEFCYNGTGWQSWSPGYELLEGENYQRYISCLIPQLKKYITVPETIKSKSFLYGQFINYCRWGNTYLVMVSTGNVGDKTCPPVQYQINRKEKTIACHVYANGKKWNQNELMAEICFFIVDSYFDMKDVISYLYGSTLDEKMDPRFEKLQFLCTNNNDKKESNQRLLPGGWESWYNHYNKINENLIIQDLDYLDRTENLIKKMYIDNKNPVVFQIDDGWQQGLGQWEINNNLFPSGLQNLTEKISAKGYIPGLWLAPFIIDARTEFYKTHYDWVLKDKKGKPISAGFNPCWGASHGKNQPREPHSYFCLDLSNDNVINHLDLLMNKVINEWGFRYLKLDFLFAGMLYGDYVNKGAAYEWYTRAVQTLTSRSVNNNGLPVAYLGCGMPFEMSFKYLPLSRIGTDTLEHWDRKDLKLLRFEGRPSAYMSMKDTLGHAFWDQRVFINDPDVIFVRHENCSLTDKEKITLALVNFLFASQIMHADDPISFDDVKDGLLTQQILSYYQLLKDEEFGMQQISRDVYELFTRSKKYKGLLNLSDKTYSLLDDNISRCSELPQYFSMDNKRYTEFESHSISIFSDTICNKSY